LNDVTFLCAWVHLSLLVDGLGDGTRRDWWIRGSSGEHIAWPRSL